MHAGGVSTETRAGRGNQGRTDGRSDCINCHVAIPHGWKRPRLLVNGYTGPYDARRRLGRRQPGYEAAGYAVKSVADPFPYWQGRGQQLATGDQVPRVTDPSTQQKTHELNEVDRVPVWSEQRCISCSGA